MFRFTINLISMIAIVLTVCLLLSGSVVLAWIKQESKNLPDLQSIENYKPTVPSLIYSDDKSKIGQFAEQDRIFMPISEIPEIVQQAFISSEDQNFWKHNGVDPFAIARAAVTNLRNRGSGRRPLGASTITQQVIKNVLNGDEATVKRKIREALLAVQAEKDVGKKRILEIYLNEIYLGEGAYGVAAAARAYFAKPLNQLGIAEISLLAAMPKGPSNYDPVKHPEAALIRRNYVINRLLEDHVISSEQAVLANKQPLPVPQVQNMSGVGEDYFAEEARRQILNDFGKKGLYKGGLRIYTSMDTKLQSLAEKTLKDGLIEYDHRHGWRGAYSHVNNIQDTNQWRTALAQIEPPLGAESWRLAVVLQSGKDALVGFADGSQARIDGSTMKWARLDNGRGLGAVPRQASDVLKLGDVVLTDNVGGNKHLEIMQIPQAEGALVAIEAKTGRVLAMAGGFSHEKSSLNRVTQSHFQPGSSFKPFIYLTALELGMDPTSPVLDTPISIDLGNNVPRWNPGADGGNGWGLISLRRALENSRNLASVRLLYDMGLDTVAQIAKNFGIYDGLTKFSAALGALEVTPLQITGAYAMLANGGYRIQPTFVDRVENSDGAIIAVRPQLARTPAYQVADPIPVAQLTSILQGVVRRGTAAGSLSKINLPIAGKTGTTNDEFDAWFVGFSPDIAVGVHVGFDQPRSLGRDEFGGRAAAPIFGAFMQGALSLYPPSSSNFILPPGIKTVKVDPQTGEPSTGKNAIDEILPEDNTSSAH